MRGRNFVPRVLSFLPMIIEYSRTLAPQRIACRKFSRRRRQRLSKSWWKQGLNLKNLLQGVISYINTVFLFFHLRNLISEYENCSFDVLYPVWYELYKSGFCKRVNNENWNFSNFLSGLKPATKYETLKWNRYKRQKFFYGSSKRIRQK